LNEFIEEHTSTISGSNQSRIPYSTFTEFLLKANKEGIDVSLPTMTKYLRKNNKKRGMFDRYLCLICLNKEENKDAYKKHQKIVEHQNSTFKKHRDNLQEGELVVVYDYTTIHEIPAKKIKNLSLCFRKKGEDHFFRDFIAIHPHNYEYTATVWNQVLEDESIMNGIRKLIIWSDGGLKVVESINLLSEHTRKKEIEISVNFYASYHGHNIVDGHFATGKRECRKKTEKPINEIGQVAECFSNIKNTVAKVVEIARLEKRCKSMRKGIRKWKQYNFQKGEICCRELSDDKTELATVNKVVLLKNK
jgi:hypothetical protein